MGKKANPRRCADDEAIAINRGIRVSPQKINLLARQIRGMRVDRALEALKFSKRRIAIDVRKTLESAIANATENHSLDVDLLFVTEAYVGKGLNMKRGHPRARGRFARIIKPFSHLTIKVREVEDL